MSIIFILIPLSMALATIFLAAFIWAVRSGQYDDTCTPAMRLLVPDSSRQPTSAPPQRILPVSASARPGEASKPSEPTHSPFMENQPEP